MEENLKDQESKDAGVDAPLNEKQEQEANKKEAKKGDKKAKEEKKAKAVEAESEENLPSLEEAMKALAQLRLELRETKKEMEEQKSQNMRLQADFINFRKRKEKEVADMARFANEDLLKELLPVLDNFDRTLDAIEKTDNLSAVKEGISLVSSNMRRQLKKIGLEPIDSKGKAFDVNLHDAITSIPVEDEKQKGVVIDEVEKGYKLKEKVIRFSKVVVGE